MTIVDLCIVVALVAAAVRGTLRGFLLEITGPVGLALGIVAAARWTAEWEGFARSTLLLPEPLPAAAAFVGIAAAIFLAAVLTATILDHGLGAGFRRILNRFMGTLLGAAKGAGVAAAFLLIVDWSPASPLTGGHRVQGALATPLAEAARGLLRLSAAGVEPVQEP